MGRRLPWLLLGLLVLAQVCYPLTGGDARAALTVLTVVLGWSFSVTHAGLTRGPRAALALLGTATLGGFAVEAVGVATGFPFGEYDYSGRLGPKLLGVPLIIPLAWTWMAWPAWLAAGVLVRPVAARVAVAAWALAAWDLFLDPQMVAERYWTWRGSLRGLPGVPDVPLGNYLGWLVVALVMMAVLAMWARGAASGSRDGVMHVLYLWTYCSSVLAHAVFLGLPWSALWGGLAMGAVAVPLGVRQWRSS